MVCGMGTDIPYSLAQGLRRCPAVGKTVRLLSIRGIPVRVHASWLLIYALITWTLAAGYFPHVLPGLDTTPAILLAMGGALLLFVSVLVHELSHSFVAIGYGLRVRAI